MKKTVIIPIMLICSGSIYMSCTNAEANLDEAIDQIEGQASADGSTSTARLSTSETEEESPKTLAQKLANIISGQKRHPKCKGKKENDNTEREKPQITHDEVAKAVTYKGDRGTKTFSYTGTVDNPETIVLNGALSFTGRNDETVTVDIKMLTWKKECFDAGHYAPVIGVKTYKSNDKNRTTDFGDGTCDETAMVTKNGETEEVNLKEMHENRKNKRGGKRRHRKHN